MPHKTLYWLGPGWIDVNRDIVQYDGGPDIEIDCSSFANIVNSVGNAGPEKSAGLIEEHAEQLRRAAAL
jgi:hypothetical protein